MGKRKGRESAKSFPTKAIMDSAVPFPGNCFYPCASVVPLSVISLFSLVSVALWLGGKSGFFI
jgi:hypothetical protein